MVDNMGRDSVHLHKLLGKPLFLFLRRNVVLAVKRLEADLLKYAEPENADVVSGSKNF